MEICQLRIGKSTRPAAAAAFATAFVCLLSQVADSPARPKTPGKYRPVRATFVCWLGHFYFLLKFVN